VQFEEQLGGRVEIGNSPTCVGNTVRGNLQVYKNRATVQSRIETNSAYGNLQHYENRGNYNIFGNDIKGNLQCFSNAPPPTGGGNTAAQKQGQCRLL
jgi:hypothetical protein